MNEAAASRLIGFGIYTIPEAARLSQAPPRSIRRWILGYEYVRADERRTSPPVVRPEIRPIDGVPALSFRDLQEVRFLQAFRSRGVSWPSLRIASQKAAELIGHSHPFSTGKFWTDGRTILTDVAAELADPALLDIVRSQVVFRQVIAPYLRGLELVGDSIVRWWPMGESRRVVIDPQRSFGQPIVAEAGVPTAILARAVKVERSVARVARWYDVAPAAVRDAVQYEASLARAA